MKTKRDVFAFFVQHAAVLLAFGWNPRRVETAKNFRTKRNDFLAFDVFDDGETEVVLPVVFAIISEQTSTDRNDFCHTITPGFSAI